MQRYEIIEAPPQPKLYYIVDNLAEGFVIGQFETEEEALDFLNTRQVRDKLLI